VSSGGATPRQWGPGRRLHQPTTSRRCRWSQTVRRRCNRFNGVELRREGRGGSVNGACQPDPDLELRGRSRVATRSDGTRKFNEGCDKVIVMVQPPHVVRRRGAFESHSRNKHGRNGIKGDRDSQLDSAVSGSIRRRDGSLGELNVRPRFMPHLARCSPSTITRPLIAAAEQRLGRDD